LNKLKKIIKDRRVRKHFFAIFIAALILALSVYLFAEKEDNKMTKEKNEKVIALPAPREKGALSLEECIRKRRSVRDFAPRKLAMDEVSQLLWSAQGITDESRNFRAAPSAGALYPLEIYLVKEDGLFHYMPKGHKIEQLAEKDLRPALAQAAYGQSSVAEASADIVICAVYERVSAKYREKGIRYTDMEAGHAAQNLHLQAVSLGLASVPIGAFAEEAAAKILSLPRDCKPIYIISIGEPKK